MQIIDCHLTFDFDINIRRPTLFEDKGLHVRFPTKVRSVRSRLRKGFFFWSFFGVHFFFKFGRVLVGCNACITYQKFTKVVYAPFIDTFLGTRLGDAGFHVSLSVIFYSRLLQI